MQGSLRNRDPGESRKILTWRLVLGWKRGREEDGGEGEGYNAQGGPPQDAWRARAKQRSKLEPGPSPQHVM